MATEQIKLEVNPIDWATRDTGFIPNADEIWYYYNNSSYPNTIIYLIGDGTNTIENLTIYTVMNDQAQSFLGLKTFKGVKADYYMTESATITAGTYNARSVSNIGILICNTAAGDITINGLTGGTTGQELTIIKNTAANNLIINHNSGSATDEAIITPTGATITDSNYANRKATFTGTNWYLGN